MALNNNSGGYFLAQGELYFSDNDFQNINRLTTRNQYQITAYAKVNGKLLVIGHPTGANDTYLGESMDNGITWKFEKLWDNQLPVKLLYQADQLWIATNQRLWRKEGENAWESLFTINANTDVALNDFIITGMNTILIKTANHNLYRSENNGEDWALVQGLPQASSSQFYIADQKIYVYGAFQKSTGPTGGALYLSTDDGQTWQQETIHYFIERQIQSFTCSESHCYISGGYGLLLRKRKEQPLAVEAPVEKMNHVFITPNPVDKHVKIKLNKQVGNSHIVLNISDLRGNLVFSQAGCLAHINHQLNQVIGQFKPAIYLVHLQYDHWQGVDKFIKF